MLRQINVQTMKHGEIVSRLSKLEAGLTEAKNLQIDVINHSKLLSPVCDYSYISAQCRGRRRYLNWRQRYYKRPFFKINDEHGTYLLKQFSDHKTQILDLEHRRIFANFAYQTTVYEHDQLLQMMEQIGVWRKLRDGK